VLRIIIETIPHASQRYDTVGDYWVDPDGTWQVRISALPDWRAEMCIALHELIEKALCVKAGIRDVDIDEFDQEFLNLNGEEPGDDPRAPYYRQHQVAVAMEHFIASQLDLSWREYALMTQQAGE